MDPTRPHIATLDDGEVLELTRSMALKLKTEVELRFSGGNSGGRNVAAAYAGVYSLWLRRAGDDWRLVLNREPDIWGTMRDPAADVGEAPLIHQRVPDTEAKPTFEATMAATNGGGVLDDSLGKGPVGRGVRCWSWAWTPRAPRRGREQHRDRDFR